MRKLSTIWKETTDTFLYLSVLFGSVTATKVLLRLGVDPNADDGLTLVMAADAGNTKIVKALLEAGADVHGRNNSALKGAKILGRTETVAVLEEAMKHQP